MRLRSAALAAFGCLAVCVSGCAGGGAGALKSMSPVQPLETYEGDYAGIVIDEKGHPQPVLELTQEGVTVRVQYWRKADLDRKYNRGSMGSAFYYEPTWKQGERVTVFHVSIHNGLDKAIRTKPLSDINPAYMFLYDDLRLRKDMDPNFYIAMPEEDNKKRLMSKKGMTIDLRNGLEAVSGELLENRIVDLQIGPGETAEGWVPFFGIKYNIIKHLWLSVSVETPPDSDIGRYKRVEFVFPYTFSREIQSAQPATIRY